MRLPRPTSALVLAVFSLLPPTTRGMEFVMFRNMWGDVIVATDTTAAGRAITPPTPNQPVYYRGMSLGRRLGSIPGDYEPDEKQLNRFVAEVLAKQGYRGARPGLDEPTLFLIVQWGYLDPRGGDNLWFLGYNPEQDIGAPIMPGIIGPEVFRLGMRSRTAETILQDAQNPLYGIIITAFEYKSARTTSPIVYWQTRIGLPATGKSMAAALPTMLVAAGPAIGRPADGPVRLDTDNAREGTVKFGELKFFDTLNEPESGKDPARKN